MPAVRPTGDCSTGRTCRPGRQWTRMVAHGRPRARPPRRRLLERGRRRLAGARRPDRGELPPAGERQPHRRLQRLPGGRESARRAGRRAAAIVVTSSVHVQMAFPAMSVYGGTKQALRALVEHMAIELAPHGITANHVGPGWVRSYINDASPALQTDGGRRDDAHPDPGRTPGRAGRHRATRSATSPPTRPPTSPGAFLRVDGGFVVGKY